MSRTDLLPFSAARHSNNRVRASYVRPRRLGAAVPADRRWPRERDRPLRPWRVVRRGGHVPRRQIPGQRTVVDGARLLVIPAEPFRCALQANNERCFRMMGSMAVHLRRLVAPVEQLTLRSSTERPAEFLLYLAPSVAESAIVHLPYDKGLIAARLEMQPGTLSRALAKLRPLAVETKGSRVTIRDASGAAWALRPAGT